jgi:hypothetical protein
METAVANPVKTLPLKSLFSDFLLHFRENLKGGDTVKSNPWIKELHDRTTRILSGLASSYGCKLRPMGGVGRVRTDDQYLNFCKPPLTTNRGFFPSVFFRFEDIVVEYGLGYSDENSLPRSFIEAMREVARERLADFTALSRQGLPLKKFDLNKTTDEELTKDLIRLLDVYQECVSRLSPEIAEFGNNRVGDVLTPQQLDIVLDRYLAWCALRPDDAHLRGEHDDQYKKWSREYFQTLPLDRFVNEMTEFVGKGGGVQSRAYRFQKTFIKGLVGNEEAFRKHLLRVYDQDFDLHGWWKDSDAFLGFGEGTRSIFLHRAFPDRFAIFNDKASAGYHRLGVLPLKAKRKSVTYDEINAAAHSIVNKRPEKLTLFLADHLTHYITVPEGRELVEKLLTENSRNSLAAPFSSIFVDRNEADIAFDLVKETLEHLGEGLSQSDRVAVTLPRGGSSLSVNWGSRLVLQFKKTGNRLLVVYSARKSDLGAEEDFEAGEFSVDRELAGIGLQTRTFDEFIASPELQERHRRALAETKRTYSRRTSHARFHLPALQEAAFNQTIREKLFREGIELSYATMENEEPVMQVAEGNKKIARGRNCIYFGPPGTGKTWTLLNEERQRFVVSASSTTREEQLQALVADESWWVVVGAALYKMGPSKVPELMKHPLVAARLALTKLKAPKSSLWVALQTHTSPECQNVGLTVASRIEPYIFSKSSDSTWSIVADRLAEEAPEVVELAEAMDNEAASAQIISRYETVTFHQSFSYEDFIEGIKPRVGSDGGAALGYEIQPGVFKRLCDRARADKEHEYAIFIDEINRGNVASIFGELISLIEEDKREGALQELSVRLPYSKELFSVPANVSIIGTMNSADRSVEALDSALRRRFSFKEVLPNVNVLRQADLNIEGVDIPRIFEVINHRLEKLLNRDHQIGHAYFLELANGNRTLGGLRSLFQSKVIPLLQEYFYSDVGRIGLVLGDAFVEKVQNAEFANFDYSDADLLRERQIYRLKAASRLTAEDFRSIYGG